jgi:uroporphyrinogen-III decarboxylase
MWFVEMFGYQNFMIASLIDPERFKQITLQFLQITKRDITAMCHVTDLPLIGCHDDICDARGPLFEPDWFRENIFPYYNDVFKIIHDAGKKVFFCSDGYIMPLLNDMRKFDIDGLAIDHNNDLSAVLEAFHKKIVFGGKINPSIVAVGKFEQIEAAIKENIAMARHEPGYFFSSGSVNGLLPNDRAEFYYECFNKYAKR